MSTIMIYFLSKYCKNEQHKLCSTSWFGFGFECRCSCSCHEGNRVSERLPIPISEAPKSAINGNLNG